MAGPETAPSPVRLDLAAARRWALSARSMLADAREGINALNVFPVPDGDTGTNMFLTMDGSLDVLRGHHQARTGAISLTEGLALIARGMLLSARGNSGVILSQLVRGLHEAVAAAGEDLTEVGPLVLADAYARADRFAWDGVSTPVEGTILSVSRAAAQGAAAAVTPESSVHTVAKAALDSARAALARTPEQLPVLARAGVVDAGGAGLVVVLEALERVLTESGETEQGEDDAATLQELRQWLPTGDRAAVGIIDETFPDMAHAGADCAMEGGGYEVMYLLTGSDPERAQHLRSHLTNVGDSVLVVGGPAEWRVHVHLAATDVALEAGAMAGRVERVTVTALPEPLEGTAKGSTVLGDGTAEDGAPVGPESRAARRAVGVVACAAGEGMVEILVEAGAEVVRSTPGDRASTGQLLSAVWAVGASAVIVLPNDPDVRLAADAAAQTAAGDSLAVHVVPSRSSVQGLAALAVFDPDGDLETNLAAMKEAVEASRHGAVTVASKDGHTPVGPCRQGQALGLLDWDIAVVSDTSDQAIAGVLGLLLDPGPADSPAEPAELLTVVVGLDADRAAGLAVVREVAAAHDGLEIEVVEGRQRTYPWVFGVE